MQFCVRVKDQGKGSKTRALTGVRAVNIGRTTYIHDNARMLVKGNDMKRVARSVFGGDSLRLIE